MIRLRHRDRRTYWEQGGVTRAEAPAVILQLILQNRTEQPGEDRAALRAPAREVDPTGWHAVWVTRVGDVERETPLPIPPLPPFEIGPDPSNVMRTVRRF